MMVTSIFSFFPQCLLLFLKQTLIFESCLFCSLFFQRGPVFFFPSYRVNIALDDVHAARRGLFVHACSYTEKLEMCLQTYVLRVQIFMSTQVLLTLLNYKSLAWFKLEAFANVSPSVCLSLCPKLNLKLNMFIFFPRILYHGDLCVSQTHLVPQCFQRAFFHLRCVKHRHCVVKG